MNNYNISVSNNQSFSKHSFNIAHWLGGSIPANIDPEPISHKVFTNIRYKITSCILRYINAHDVAFPSHETIAQEAGCNRDAVIKYLNWAEEIGLFKIVHRRNSWESNIYFLGDILKDHRVRWALRNVFAGLNRAFHKTVTLLNDALGIVKNTVNKQDHTLLISINVFKKNTSDSSYRERRLYSTPFLKKEDWMNKQKAMWADWSLKDEDFQYEIPKKVITLGVLGAKVSSASDPIHLKGNLILSQPEFTRQCDLIKSENNLSLRLELYEMILHKAPGASRPFVQSLIRKTHQAINKEKDALPF